MYNRYVLRVYILLGVLCLREAGALPCLGGTYGSNVSSICWDCDGDEQQMLTRFNGVLFERNEYHSSTFMGDCICREGTKGSRNGVFPRCQLIPTDTYWSYHKVRDTLWWEGTQGYWETTATTCPNGTHTNHNAPITDWHGDITGYKMAGANSITGCICNQGANCSSVNAVEAATSTPAAIAGWPSGLTESIISSAGHHRVSGLLVWFWVVIPTTIRLERKFYV